MKIVQETITPEKAEEYLGTMRSNRNVKPKWLAELERRINNGEWDPNNPQPISFAGEKTLIDGQHRLLAVVGTRKSIKCWVAREVPQSAISNIDTGKARSMADLLRMKGEVNVAMVSGTLRQLLKYRQSGELGQKGLEPSHFEMLELLEKEPVVRDVINAVGELRHIRLGVGPSMWGALWILFGEQDENDADEFIELMKTGEGLQNGSPILALRKALLNMQYPRPPRHNAALVIKAWNAWRAGEEIQTISWKAGGKSPEAFPQIR